MSYAEYMEAREQGVGLGPAVKVPADEATRDASEPVQPPQIQEWAGQVVPTAQPLPMPTQPPQKKKSAVDIFAEMLNPPPPEPLDETRLPWWRQSSEYTESNRKDRRTVFMHDDWVRHRSSERFVRNILSIGSSGINAALSKELTFVTLTAIFVVLANAALVSYQDFEGIVHVGPLHAFDTNIKSISLPALPFSIAMPALSLLLVFRTNSSYSRWWEARILWGGTVNNCRSLARETLCGMRTTTPHLCGRVLRMIVAYVYCLTAHLQGLSDANIRATLEEKCAPNEVEMLMGSKHRPGACLHAMGQVIRAAQRRGEIDNITHLYLAERVHTLTDGMGACERILRTTIPLSYTRHTSRFLTMWLGFLPFALVPQMGWVAVPTMFLTSLLLLGVDEIGVQIEEPFRRLPLKAISGVIEASVRGYLEEHDDMLPITEAAMPMNGAAAVAQPAISVA